MRLKIWLISFILSFSLNQQASACTITNRVNIFVAASLLDIMQEIANEYSRQNLCNEIRIIAGSSAIMAKQILAGAPADIFISADRYNANLVAEKNQLSYNKLFGNSLVIASAEDFNEINLAQLPKEIAKGQRLSIGDPEHVPMGIYAKQALISANVWSELERGLVPAGDARAAASFVKNGATKFGVIYLTLAKSFNLNIVGQVNESSYSEIAYYGILLDEDNWASKDFFEFLGSNLAKRKLQQMGFKIFSDD